MFISLLNIQLNPYNPKYLPVGGDAFGMDPRLLEQSLKANWKPSDCRDPTSDIPKVGYRHRQNIQLGNVGCICQLP